MFTIPGKIRFSVIAIVMLLSLPSVRADNIKMFDSASDPQEVARFLSLIGVKTRGLFVDTANVAGFTVNFDFDSAVINPVSLGTVNIIGKALHDPMLVNMRFQIEGHTDATGKEGYNMNLSEKRAESIKNYLVLAYGINEENLVIKGFGESQLIDNIPATDKMQRRVQLRPLPR